MEFDTLAPKSDPSLTHRLPILPDPDAPDPIIVLGLMLGTGAKVEVPSELNNITLFGLSEPVSVCGNE